MKKLVAVLMAALMLVGMASVASAEWTFERKIDIICPWGVGGGADSTLRPMTNLLKDILGQQVDVVNVEGGGGVNGVEYTYKQPADGYTFMLGTQSLILLDLQKPSWCTPSASWPAPVWPWNKRATPTSPK